MKKKAYGRTELAQQYLPNLTPPSAWRVLNEWINYSPRLVEELKNLGYDGKKRVFTPAQAQAIMRHLGEP